MRVLDPLDLIRRPTAEQEAGAQYARAVERHFDEAQTQERLGQPEEADSEVRVAVLLRLDAHSELRP